MLSLFRNDRGAALLEAAIALPFVLILTVGIVDLGMGMYQAMVVNAAAQAGATYAVLNQGSTVGDQILLNAAADNITITDPPVSCIDPTGGLCVAVTASYQFNPLFSSLVSPLLINYVPWLPSTLIITSTAYVRVE